MNPYRFLMRLLTGATVAIALQASPAFAQSANTDAALRFRAPAPVRMAYDVKGVISSPYTGSAELLWDHDGKRYQSELLIRKFGLTLQKWTSQGSVGQRGLEPDKFTSKRLGQSEISASFQRAAGRVSFSEGSPDASLQNGAQDQLSVFMHLAGLLGGLGSTGAAGKSLGLQAIGDKYAEQWSFLMGAADTIALPSGSVQAIPFTHEPTAERKQRLEIWYAPSLQFLPVRIRITESNGDYLDLVWANSQNR